MGLSVSDVIERATEEIFEAGGVARPAWDIQSGAITSSGTTLTLEGRQTYVPPDGDVEWDDSSMEVSDVKSVSSTTVTLQTRGLLGTTAASHTSGTRVFLDNPYKKQVLFNGLKAVIQQLYGYGIGVLANSAGTLTYSETTPVTLPTGAKDVAGGIVWVIDGTDYWPLKKGTHFHLIHAFTPPKIRFRGGGWTGRALYFDYLKDFDVSTFALTTDLDTVGIPATLQPHMATGLAGWILQGRDVPLLESEHIRPDPQNPQPPGTRFSVGKTLWNSFLTGPVYAEHVRFLQEHPPQVIEGVG